MILSLRENCQSAGFYSLLKDILVCNELLCTDLTVLWSANYTDLSVVTILFFFHRRYIYEDLNEKF